MAGRLHMRHRDCYNTHLISMKQGDSVHRDWIDRWKGQLIFLVVFAHVLGGTVRMMTGEAQHVFDRLYLVIYSFHMPAFFALAGMLWRPRAGEGFVDFSKRKFVRLMVPYFIFGICSALVYALFSDAFFTAATASQSGRFYMSNGHESWWMPFASLLTTSGWPFDFGMKMNQALWFLPGMFSCLLVFWIVDWILGRNPLAMCGVAVACFLLWGMLRYNAIWSALPWKMGVVPRYLPYMIFGRVALSAMENNTVPSKWPRASLVAALSGLCLFIICSGIGFGFIRTHMVGIWFLVLLVLAGLC